MRYPKNLQTVTASVADEAGNDCVAAAGGLKQLQLTVNSVGCELAFAPAGPISNNLNGNWLNRAGAGLPEEGATPSSASAAVAAVAPDCGAGRSVYLYAGPPSAMPTGMPQTTGAGGAVTFPAQAFNEGGQYTVSIDDGAGLLTHQSFTVSLKAPTVAGRSLQRSASLVTAVAVAKNAALTFGAAEGNRRVATATAGDLVFGDLDGAQAGAQFQLALTGIDGARVAPFNARLEILEGTTPLTSAVTVDAEGFNTSLPRLTLAHRPDDSTASLVLRVTSPAGNTYTSTHIAQVDVVAPAAPAVTRTLAAARTATVNLSWDPVYDDGSDASSGGLVGPGAGYDVRWSTSSVPSNNGLALESDYFGSSARQDGVLAWSASDVARSLLVPPLNTYFIAVRAVDEVGNYSAYAAPAALDNLWTQVTVANPSTEGTGAHAFGQNLVTGVSLNGDALPELIVAAPSRGAGSTGGSVYIYWGGVAADTATCVAPACQELRPDDGVAGLFGTDLSAAGNVGDVAGESRADLLVSQPTFQGNVGRAFLYFGTTGAALDAANFVEFRGASGVSFASAARIIKDLDGDGLDELAFSAHTEESGRGRLYIFKGRSADPAFNSGTPGANWFNSRTGNDNGRLYVPHTAATWVLLGPAPVDSGGNQFARLRWGLVSLGDITGDGRNDFVVPQSKDSANGNRVFLYSGATVAASSAPLEVSSALQQLLAPGGNAGTNTNDGFGRAAVAGPLVGATGIDLFVSQPRRGRIDLFAELTATGTGVSPSATIMGAQGPWFGYHFSACDLNGDGRTDLLAGEAPTSGGRAFVVWQRTDGTFEPTVDRIAPAFWASELSEATGSSRQGRMTACDDASGDGNTEVILGDEGLNRVRIYR